MGLNIALAADMLFVPSAIFTAGAAWLCVTLTNRLRTAVIASALTGSVDTGSHLCSGNLLLPLTCGLGRKNCHVAKQIGIELLAAAVTLSFIIAGTLFADLCPDSSPTFVSGLALAEILRSSKTCALPRGLQLSWDRL